MEQLAKEAERAYEREDAVLDGGPDMPAHGEHAGQHAKTTGEGSVVDELINQLSPREIGRLGERLSAEFLQRMGMKVLDRNLRTKGGEVDLVLDDDGERVLCEVKSRRVDDANDRVMPEASVTPTKQARYHKIAQFYLRDHPEVELVRFDVCAVKIRSTRVASIRYLPAAFYVDA